MSNLKGCYSHKSDDWKTPSDLFNEFMNDGFIDCFQFNSSFDEFEKEYKNKKLFVNPPYSKLNKIVEWTKKQYSNNCYIYMLIPARTDTKYFHELMTMKPFIYFIKGRLHFNDSNSAPFPSIIMVFHQWWFHTICYDSGDLSKFIQLYIKEKRFIV